MALLAAGLPLTEKEVFEWLLENFGHFNKLAIESYYVSDRRHDSPAESSARQFRREIAEIHKQMELPIEVVTSGGEKRFE